MTDFLIEQGMTERDASNVTALAILALALFTVRVLHEIYAVVVLGFKPSWSRHHPVADNEDD